VVRSIVSTARPISSACMSRSSEGETGDRNAIAVRPAQGTIRIDASTSPFTDPWNAAQS
jgi:hypothetical protein